LDKAKELACSGLTLVGGTNALSLQPGQEERLRKEIEGAMKTLGPTGRFILHPVDALFPDTPFGGVEKLIECWQEHR
jgi:hypothetical protein